MASFRKPSLESLAIPAVSILIVFLSYTSQYLFHHIDPGPLSRKEAIWFNAFILAIWWSYYKACTVDPGKKGWVEGTVSAAGQNKSAEDALQKGLRWCKKCDAVKPPRAHHCKKCQRCIPKMDHHCPWTTNCVSHTTFPHFIRFVFYTVLSMSILTYHLFNRCYLIWANRALPAYLGPPTWAMVHLLLLVSVNSFTLFAIGILFVRALYSLVTNATMIEDWEIERHEALVERARKTSGWVYASGGQKIKIKWQEFPYDIGFWKNTCQGMGTQNVLLWFWPFAGGPTVETALKWEENGFEDEGTPWPPPDPDKMPRSTNIGEPEDPDMETNEDHMEAFRRRQQADFRRWEKSDDGRGSDEYASDGEEEGMDGEIGWTNTDGDRLRDYGVDEETEDFADDDIPLGELIRRRKARAFEH